MSDKDDSIREKLVYAGKRYTSGKMQHIFYNVDDLHDALCFTGKLGRKTFIIGYAYDVPRHKDGYSFYNAEVDRDYNLPDAEMEQGWRLRQTAAMEMQKEKSAETKANTLENHSLGNIKKAMQRGSYTERSALLRAVLVYLT